MFENFGLKDLWSNIKKFKYVLVGLLICVIAYSVIDYVGNKSDIKQAEYHWVSSAFYDVTTKENDKDLEKEAILKRKAMSYQIMVQSDVANEYVYNRILNDFSKAELIKRCDMNISENELKPINLSELFVCKVLDSTTILNLFSQTKDEEVSKKILYYYNEYLINELQPNIEKDSLTYLSGSTQHLKISEEGKTGIGSKKIILLIGLIVVLEALFIILYSFIRPTINFKTDFEKYNVKVIAQLK